MTADIRLNKARQLQKLAEQGAKLALVDLNLEAVKQVVAELGLDDSRAIALQANVANEDEVKAYVNAAAFSSCPTMLLMCHNRSTRSMADKLTSNFGS